MPIEFHVGEAAAAGIIGGAVMTALLYMGMAMMPGQMRMNLLYLLGTMMGFRRVTAYLAGAMVHGGLSVGFALAHIGVFNAAFDTEPNFAAWGVAFGAVHWLLAGMALSMVGAMHPLVRSGHMTAPGAFALGYGPVTAMGFLMLHLVYGVLAGSLYGAFN